MSQQPKTETDRLTNVIQVLQMGQKTGRLIVERNDGPLFDQGMITLVNGQVVQASLNQLQGPEAFNRLKNWGACRFTFTPEQKSGAISRIPTQPPGGRMNGHRSFNTSPLPVQRPGPTYSPEDFRHRTTRNLGEARQPVPTAWLATPYRTRHIEEGMHLIEHMGLSRAHRRLFLLIDGGRTVKELIRLMSH